jgi:hypothetical protein
MDKTNKKILYITSDTSDYQSDSLFHGLRTLYGDNVVDYPKSEKMYKLSNENLSNLHGKGFTCYALLDDIFVDRLNIFEKVKQNYFDLIIFSSIHRQFGFFVQFYPWLNFNNTVIVDGEDTPSFYKFCGNFWRQPSWFFLPKAHSKFLYFKRELNQESLDYLYYLLLPKWFLKFLQYPQFVRKINFSIPEEKITKSLKTKTKLFARHIVDHDVSKHISNSATSYVFDNENDYYNDLQISQFSVTTKRAGWDCIRHYEIAANGAVMCFKDLELKEISCAPHGLNRTNCIIYSNYDDLILKINNLSQQEYTELQTNSLKWVQENTTKNIASNFMKTIQSELKFK